MLTNDQIRIERDTYLGPARVMAVDGPRAQVETPDAFPWAQLAVAHCYRAQVGDTVLVVGKDDAWYIIGVLQGTGASTFTAPGDIEFNAPRGSIRLRASEGVQIKGALLELTGETIEIAAKSLVQTVQDAVTWARRLLRIRAGSINTDVEKTSHLKAGDIVEHAENEVRINGKTINLS